MKLYHYTLLFFALFFLSIPAVTAQTDGSHTVQSGENLFRIALRYGVDMGDLAAANGISDPTRIFAGQVLTIPGLSEADAGDTIVNPLVAAAPVIHTVQRGEYLSQIARLYDVSMEDIMRANTIVNPDRILPGTELQIWTTDISSVEVATTPAEPASAAEPDINTVLPTPAPVTQSATHVVMRGEHLSQIAKTYGVSWTRIAEANGITDPNRIFAGMQLTIPGVSEAATSDTNQSVEIEARRAIAEAQGDPGPRWGYGREIVVDLSSQMTYAYEDGVLVFQSLVSTGLPATPTVQGEYAIWHKTPAQTMSGPGYYLPGVQWVMYFYRGYGFHGTYWHNNFGQPMSHGCVNMTNVDAEWLYNFASIGTNVYVQY